MSDDNTQQKQDVLSKINKRRHNNKGPLNAVCPLCVDGVKNVSYKDVYLLKKFTSNRGRIIGRAKTGVCANHQRQLSRAIKRARQLALMPFVNID